MSLLGCGETIMKSGWVLRESGEVCRQGDRVLSIKFGCFIAATHSFQTLRQRFSMPISRLMQNIPLRCPAELGAGKVRVRRLQKMALCAWNISLLAGTSCGSHVLDGERQVVNACR